MTCQAVVATGLVRRFGKTLAVNDVSLEVPLGSLFGLLGPDGAGKSTLLRLLATVTAAESGDAMIFGSSVTTQPAEVHSRIGYMSQQFCLYPDLSGAENLEFFARLRGVGKADRHSRAERLLTSMGMAEFAGRQAGRLSGGMKQKLMLSVTLMHEPDLLLLDEPTTGVDPVSRMEFWQILAELQSSGKTVMVATPNMDEAQRCSHLAFMDGGRITKRGTPEEIKALLPGRVVEVSGAPPRQILAALGSAEGEKADGVLSTHLLGESVRVLWDGGEPHVLADRLAAEGITATAREVNPDMEAAFAYLAESGSGQDDEEVPA